MGNLYRVVPLEKKSVVYKAEMYRNNADGTLSWFNVSTTYRSGMGYLDDENDMLPFKGAAVVNCRLETGFGCEFDDVIDCEFEFSEDLSEDEQSEIENSYNEGYQGWLYDGSHTWEFEYATVEILAPYKIQLVDGASGEVIKEDVELEEAPQFDSKKSVKYPFPT